MPTVSNTSPISNLAVIEKLPLLKELFGEVWIPLAVRDELSLLSCPQASKQIEYAISEGWIKIVPCQQNQMISLLCQALDRGEAEAITLAQESAALWLLIDEREGRQIAKSIQLKVTGVMGVLLRSKRVGLISDVKIEIQKLRHQAHFFISPELELEVLKTANEA